MKRDCLALLIILLIAASLRWYGIAWDSGYLFHPDERKILLVAADLHLPASLLEFFSADSPLNPKFFAYGSFPIYLLKVLSIFAPPIDLNVPWREDFVSMAMLGRVLSVLFDLGTIGMTFLLARRFYNSTVGLLASVCIAVTVLHIQLAHFYAVDTLLTLLVLVTIYFAARYAESNSRRDAVLIGVTFGLALATKISAAPLIAPIVVAGVRAAELDADQRGQTQKIVVNPRSSAREAVRLQLRRIWQVRQTLARILGAALATFILTQPYALLDPIRYLGQVGTELLVARGWLDYPYTRQYADTLPAVYPIMQSSVWGMSLPLGILAWAGSALFAWRWWRTRNWMDGFILAWAVCYFLSIGFQYAKYLRYLLPLLPFLFLMASAVLIHPERSQAGSQDVSRITHHVLRFTFYVSIFIAFIYALSFDSLYSRQHPWLTISQWMYANIPAQSTLAIEHWDDALPVPIRTDTAEHTPKEYRTLVLPMYDVDDAKKMDTLVEMLSASDYIVLATQRLSATIMRLPQRYPVSSRYYRLLFDGKLGFELEAHALNGIALDGIAILDDRFNGETYSQLPRSDASAWNWGRADESFTVYDHPMPLVFKKTHTLSKDELRKILQLP